ncbi:MAG: DNA-binding protein [Lachnospiraceae bacterium]|nr:DNA-binding protein [Ruminococcus sp.]MCM1274427.1 DNA-binding protein [Lachnospiraceae bacterium]
MNIDFVLLLDIYGELLSKGRREALDLRYNSDLSLSEIAVEMGGVSRQSVNDFIKKGEKHLIELERVLGMAERHKTVGAKLARANEIVAELKRDGGGERVTELGELLNGIGEAFK